MGNRDWGMGGRGSTACCPRAELGTGSGIGEAGRKRGQGREELGSRNGEIRKGQSAASSAESSVAGVASPTAREYPAGQVGTGVPAGPRGENAAWSQARHRCARRSQTPCLRPTEDDQPYLKEIECRVQSAESSAQSIAPDAALSNPQPLPPCRARSAHRRSALPGYTVRQALIRATSARAPRTSPGRGMVTGPCIPRGPSTNHHIKTKPP